MLLRQSRMRRIAFALAWVVSAALLVRFALDFTAAFWPFGGLRHALVLTFWALVLAALTVAASNVLSAGKASERAPASLPVAIVLRAAVPTALLASSLGCAGLAAWECSGVCGLLRWVGVPVIAAAALLPVAGRRLPPEMVLALAAVALWPHCVCENPANAWWLARLGASPMCHAWSFTASLVALSALSSRTNLLSSLVVCGAIVGGSLAFFAGHHFAGYPW